MNTEIFTALEGVEHDSAMAALLHAGFEPADFVLEECRHDVHLPGGDIETHKLVRVKRLATGFQHQYNCGSGGGWPFEFERDLGLHVFGECAAIESS